MQRYSVILRISVASSNRGRPVLIITAISALADRFRSCFDGLAAIGRSPTGYRRLAWTEEDRMARDWFRQQAEGRGLEEETDRNGNLWAWWGDPGPGAVATGSHLDTVPGGGAYDGALGVVSALVAIDILRQQRAELSRPVAVVCFADEEGGRFGVPTVGSRLAAGHVEPSSVLARRDDQGINYAEALRSSYIDPGLVGPDLERLQGLDAFVELHIEQGRALAPARVPIGIATEIWPHGRWRMTITGEADHAGTARPSDRRDPMLGLATAIEAARRLSTATQVATVGKVLIDPNGTNVVPAQVQLWIDARAERQEALDSLVVHVDREVVNKGDGLEIETVAESRTPGVVFPRDLRARLSGTLTEAGIDHIELATAAGHDAGVLSDYVPSAMLFVRNPTGVSHSPREAADEADCVTGCVALAAVLGGLAG